MSSIFAQLSTVGVVLVFVIVLVAQPATAGTWLSFTQGGNQPNVGDIENKLIPSLPTSGDLTELMKDCNTLYREAIRKRISTSTLLKRDAAGSASLVLCQRLFQLLNKE
uniref:Secreted protein n=1 Tax=Plectus sambesii TaxID=2011161 RepID=A0A914XQK9_9BILA